MNVGDVVKLQKQDVNVVKCEKCGALMVNLDEKDLAVGDLKILKDLGLRVSNPRTTNQLCLKCEIEVEEPVSNRSKVNDYFEDEEHHEDSGFFSGGLFGGFGGFGGGGGDIGSFGGGGGSFGGGGASGSW